MFAIYYPNVISCLETNILWYESCFASMYFPEMPSYFDFWRGDPIFFVVFFLERRERMHFFVAALQELLPACQVDGDQFALSWNLSAIFLRRVFTKGVESCR